VGTLFVSTARGTVEPTGKRVMLTELDMREGPRALQVTFIVPPTLRLREGGGETREREPTLTEKYPVVKATELSAFDTTLIWYWLKGFMIPLGVHRKGEEVAVVVSV
jgi:hypothetical protein